MMVLDSCFCLAGKRLLHKKTLAKILAAMAVAEANGYSPEKSKEDDDRKRADGVRRALAGKKQSPEQVRMRVASFKETMRLRKLATP